MELSNPPAANGCPMGCRSLLFTLLLLVTVVTPARAQFPVTNLNERPEPMIREALASPYGIVLTAQLAKSLKAAADPACLSAKGVADDQLGARAGELLQKWGTRTVETVLTLFDSKVYDERFVASAGPNGATEFGRLRDDATVKRYLAIERPLRLATVLDFVVQQFDRYNLVARIKIDGVSPFSTGKMELLRANPAERLESELEKFTAANGTPALQRYLALSRQAAVALAASLQQDKVLRTGPG